MTSALDVAVEVHAQLRRRWPQTTTWQRGERVGWIDGPAVIDVRGAVGPTALPLDRDHSRDDPAARGGVVDLRMLGDLDLPAPADHPTAVVLERCWSWTTLATVTLHAVDHDLDAVTELDRLDLHPLHGPPPLYPATRLDLADRATRLAAVLDPIGPIRTVDRHAVRSAVAAVHAVASSAAGLLVDDAAPRYRVDGRHDLPHPRLRVPLTGWPDLDVTAQIRPTGPAAPVDLSWVDGPTVAQIDDHLADVGTPHPLTPGIAIRCRRMLSATAIAAAVLLYHRRYRSPYRDATIDAHWLQRWRSEAVRDAEHRGRTARNRLRHLQHLLHDRPLPPTGTLQVPVLGTVDGPHLWEAATDLVSRLDDPHIRRHRPSRDARALSATIADLAWPHPDPAVSS